MAKSCVYVPSVGSATFLKLKSKYGYDLAWEMLYRGTTQEFKDKYKDILDVQPDGVPTAESLLATPYMRKLIGASKLMAAEQKNYSPVEDTRENYNMLLQQAKSFNSTSEMRNSLVAIVDYASNGEDIQVKILPNTESNREYFAKQLAAQNVATRLSELFEPIGITVDEISDAERSAGRVGSVRFGAARRIGEDALSVVRVANNMEGAQAISEEFSHLLIRAKYDEPFVQRSLNLLAGNDDALREILGDQYEDTVAYHNGNMMYVAEEALGQVLQRNLIKREQEQEEPIVSKVPLLRRVLNFFRSLFAGYDPEQVSNILVEADQMMNKFAQDVLSGKVGVTEKEVRSIATDAEFNALSDRIERNIQILSDLRDTEAKRFQVQSTVDKDKVNLTLQRLSNIINSDNPTAERTLTGILRYAQEATKVLRSVNLQLSTLESMPVPERMTALRLARQYMHSYSPFIKALNEVLVSEHALPSNELEEFEDMGTAERVVEGENISIESVLTELSTLNARINARFVQTAGPLYAAFLTQFVKSDDGKIQLRDGSRMDVLSLLKEAPSDISFFDRWLDAASESGDPIVRLTDAAVKNTKNKVRDRTIEYSKRIHQLMLDAEAMGIKDFSWAFERDEEGNLTGDYLQPVSRYSFETAYAKIRKTRTPEQRRAWLHEYGSFVDGRWVANIDHPAWKSTGYSKLSSAQKEILDKFLDIKSELDALYPEGSTVRNHAIQMRKGRYQRLVDSLSSPKDFIENIQNSIEEDLFVKADSEQEYGVASDVKDFDGKSYMRLPLIYAKDLENPNELTTDLIGSLMAYSYAATNYDEMSKIVDTLEVGRILINDYRKTPETLGEKKLREKYNPIAGKIHPKLVYRSDVTNAQEQLNAYLDSKVYQRYLKDAGAFELFGKKTNANKLTSVLLKYSSIAQLGFNFLANTANVATGVSMQNIEAACGQYFGVSELLKADAEYAKQLPKFMAEIGSRVKSGKLALFDEFIDYKQDINSRMRKSKKSNILERIFGESILFMGQDAGDHWLYNRTAIAMAIRTKVKVPGNSKPISLWDALQIRDYGTDSRIKEMYLPEGTTDEEGNLFDKNDWSRKVLEVNKSLFGVYNSDDSAAANRVALGRLVLQYKKWMKPQFNKRFQKANDNVMLGDIQEGYYRTFVRVAGELLRGSYQLGALRQQLSKNDLANCTRAITELLQVMGVWALANIVDWPDDKDRPWAMKMAEYSAQRLTHELGNLAPTPMMLTEMSKTLQEPIASASALKDMSFLITSICYPPDWFNELQSGTYKGRSTLYKNFMKAPIPVVSQFRQMDRFLEDIDTNIAFYIRSY